MDEFAKLPITRSTDPDTSAAGARHIRPKQGSQAMKILAQYAVNNSGLTDEEAVTLAGIHHGWKRCADLRRLGYIEKTGDTRQTIAGVSAMVCRITQLGKDALS